MLVILGMPQYFFNILSSGQEALDTEGECLPDLDAAREEAIGGIRDIAADCVRYGVPLDLGDRIEVVDEQGKTLLAVTFREALPIRAI